VTPITGLRVSIRDEASRWVAPGDPWLDLLADRVYLFGVSSCVKGAMRKPKKPVRREPPAWEIYRLKGARAAFVGRLKGSPTAFVGVVYAEDEEGAIAVAIEEHNVRPADQWRLFARPH
jgi:hypothetical protein